jgi:hypothetical protein
MKTDRYRSWPALLMVAAAAGCAGNGQGLDQNGQPISAGGGDGGVTADFASIQAHVFTPICSKCHIGASAPQGLQLDAAHSYNLLVGVPSNEQPELLRVKPGDPDASYMVHKIEGLAGIDGGQMPLGETPLPQATIAAIRQWVTDGAANSAPASAAVQQFALQGSAPVAGAAVMAPLARVIVTFTHDLDASLVNETTVILERVAQADDSGMTSDAQRVPAVASLARANAAVILITPRVPLPPGDYRVTLRGTGGAPLADLRTTTLGADISFRFTLLEDVR